MSAGDAQFVICSVVRDPREMQASIGRCPEIIAKGSLPRVNRNIEGAVEVMMHCAALLTDKHFLGRHAFVFLASSQGMKCFFRCGTGFLCPLGTGIPVLNSSRALSVGFNDERGELCHFVNFPSTCSANSSSAMIEDSGSDGDIIDLTLRLS